MRPTLPDNLGELQKTNITEYINVIVKYTNDLQDYTLELQTEHMSMSEELIDWWKFATAITMDDEMTIEQAREIVQKMIEKWAS